MNMLTVNKYFKTMFSKFAKRSREKRQDLNELITIPRIWIDERGVQFLYYLPTRADELDAKPLQSLATFNQDGHTYKKVGQHVWKRDDGQVILQDIREVSPPTFGP